MTTETENVITAIDNDPDLLERAMEAVATNPHLVDVEIAADELEDMYLEYFDLVAKGRHRLKDMVNTALFVGSMWRIDWNQVARHFIDKAAQ